MYGDGVSISARIEPLAIGGGICLSDTVYAQVRNKLDVGLTKLDSAKRTKPWIGWRNVTKSRMERVGLSKSSRFTTPCAANRVFRRCSKKRASIKERRRRKNQFP